MSFDFFITFDGTSDYHGTLSEMVSYAFCLGFLAFFTILFACCLKISLQKCTCTICFVMKMLFWKITKIPNLNCSRLSYPIHNMFTVFFPWISSYQYLVEIIYLFIYFCSNWRSTCTELMWHLGKMTMGTNCFSWVARYWKIYFRIFILWFDRT